MLGDGVWEGLRLYNNKFLFLKNHINRLYEGAKSLSIDIGYTKEELIDILFDVVKKNNMSSDTHIRLIISRGLKKTPYQHPNANFGKSTIVIIPEYKLADTIVNDRGISLASVKTIRSTKDILDPRVNSLSKLNCILACIEANELDVNEGLMLDINGNISTCNSTNFFIIRDNEVWTSKGEYCLNGVTREKVIDICSSNDIIIKQKDFKLDEVYNCDEAFVTGTFAGIIPVIQIDHIQLSNGKRGDLTFLLQNKYNKLIENFCLDN